MVTRFVNAMIPGPAETLKDVSVASIADVVDAIIGASTAQDGKKYVVDEVYILPTSASLISLTTDFGIRAAASSRFRTSPTSVSELSRRESQLRRRASKLPSSKEQGRTASYRTQRALS